MRASSAAPYYLDDYVFGEERYQDGAATANNPAVIAVQQARLLWPHTPLEALVSLGCGSAPPVRRCGARRGGERKRGDWCLYNLSWWTHAAVLRCSAAAHQQVRRAFKPAQGGIFSSAAACAA